jgi:hypothetical protein
MDTLLIKLFIAHIIGDFILQFDLWVKDKEQKKLRSGYLYAHVLIHGILLIALLPWNYWPLAVLIMIMHGIVDIMKLLLQTAITQRKWFFIDQSLHIIIIVLMWSLFERPALNLSFLNDQKFLLQCMAILFITSPSAVIIRIIINKWNPEISGSRTLPLPESGSSLQSAGKYIGIIERLLVFTFAMIGRWEAIGFLIAAKSVFRFGDLKDAKDLKLTEYVLIGTLLSFGIAIAAALFVSYVK